MRPRASRRGRPEAGIAVRGDRVRARLPLALEPLGEEGFEDGGQGRHGRTFQARSARSLASARSSGVAVRYQ